MLVRIDDPRPEIVRQLLRAHEYWRLKQLAVDLVILNEKHASYSQDLQASLEAQVRASASPEHAKGGARGSIFVLRSDLVPAEARAVLRSAARAVLLSRRGSRPRRWNRPRISAEREPFFGALRRSCAAPPAAPALEFFNAWSGSTRLARYVTILGERQWTPRPDQRIAIRASASMSPPRRRVHLAGNSRITS